MIGLAGRVAGHGYLPSSAFQMVLQVEKKFYDCCDLEKTHKCGKGQKRHSHSKIMGGKRGGRFTKVLYYVYKTNVVFRKNIKKLLNGDASDTNINRLIEGFKECDNFRKLVDEYCKINPIPNDFFSNSSNWEKEKALLPREKESLVKNKIVSIINTDYAVLKPFNDCGLDTKKERRRLCMGVLEYFAMDQAGSTINILNLLKDIINNDLKDEVVLLENDKWNPTSFGMYLIKHGFGKTEIEELRKKYPALSIPSYNKEIYPDPRAANKLGKSAGRFLVARGFSKNNVTEFRKRFPQVHVPTYETIQKSFEKIDEHLISSSTSCMQRMDSVLAFVIRQYGILDHIKWRDSDNMVLTIISTTDGAKMRQQYRANYGVVSSSFTIAEMGLLLNKDKLTIPFQHYLGEENTGQMKEYLSDTQKELSKINGTRITPFIAEGDDRSVQIRVLEVHDVSYTAKHLGHVAVNTAGHRYFFCKCNSNDKFQHTKCELLTDDEYVTNYNKAQYELEIRTTRNGGDLDDNAISKFRKWCGLNCYGITPLGPFSTENVSVERMRMDKLHAKENNCKLLLEVVRRELPSQANDSMKSLLSTIMPSTDPVLFAYNNGTAFPTILGSICNSLHEMFETKEFLTIIFGKFTRPEDVPEPNKSQSVSIQRITSKIDLK